MSVPPDNLFYLEVCGALHDYLVAQEALTALVSTRIYRATGFAAPGTTPQPLARPNLTFRLAAPPEDMEGRYGAVKRLRLLFSAQADAEEQAEKVIGQCRTSLQNDTDISDGSILSHDVGYDGFETAAFWDETQRCWTKDARFYVVASQKV